MKTWPPGAKLDKSRATAEANTRTPGRRPTRDTSSTMAPAQPRYVNAGSFLNIARQVFDMMDTDLNGSLDRDEILDGVKNNKKVKHFLKTCGHEDLQF